jgi:hypothetical protein
VREQARDVVPWRELEGPWQGEPDEHEWRAFGLPCLMRRNGLGAWCGYVAVPRTHPWFERHYAEVPAEVHGGLTYSAVCTGAVCHVPRPGEPEDVWWLGFDCSHYVDLSPGLSPLGFGVTAGRTYRAFGWVFAEVEKLAAQAHAAATPGGVQ